MGATQKDKAVIDLVINGEQSKAMMYDIQKAAVNTRKELAKMVEADDPKAYRQKVAEVNALTEAHRNYQARLNASTQASKSFLDKAGSMIAGVAGGNLLSAGIQQMISLIPQALDADLKLLDSLTDIQKQVGMNAVEVRGLNEELKTFTTKTPTEELRKMAAVGGQFGVAKDQIDGFVKSADRINVALGDEFGGAEETADAVLKMRNVFVEFKSDNIETDMLRIGNALNVLSAEGAATAPVLQDFSTRMGGTLIPLGLSEAQVLGYSATLQELNVTAERGSTAVVNIFQKMLTETETFAKVAGLPIREYKDLIGKDLNGALMAYVDGLKKTSGNQVEFMSVLEKSKLTGAGEMEVLSKLTTNQAMLAEKTTLAGTALQGTDSIMAEFNTKNYALAVNLKRIKERFADLLTSDGVMGFADAVVGLTAKLLGLNAQTSKAAANYADQKTKVSELEKSLNPLLTRHDQLTKKTNLNALEQAELSRITQQITRIMPSAATQFDKFGQAIGISTEKARDAIEVQRELLKVMNKEAISEQEQTMRNLQYQQKELAKQRASGKVVSVSRNNAGTVDERKLTEQELADLDKQIKAKQQEVIEAQKQMKTLQGITSTESRRATRREVEGGPEPAVTEPSKVGSGIDLGESKTEKAARLKQEKADRARDRELRATQKQEDQLEAMISEAKQRTAKNEDDVYLKEQIAFGDKYAKMFELAKGNEDKMKEVATVMYQELASLEEHDRERKRQAELKDEADRARDRDDAFQLELTALQEQADKKQQKLTEEHENKTINDREYEDQQLMAKQQALEAELLLRQAYGQKFAEVEARLTGVLGTQSGIRVNRSRQDAETIKKAEWAIQDARRQAYAQGLDILGGFLKQNTIAYKAYIIGQKAFAIAEVIVNSGREISEIYANPTLSLLPDAGITTKTTLAAAAKIRAGINIATIAATGIQQLAGRKEGGYTDVQSLYGSPSGYVSKPTVFNLGRRSYMAGEAGTEYVIPNPMMGNPVIANLAGALEALRITGQYKQLSFGAAAAAPANGGSSANSDALFMMLIQQVQGLRGDVQSQAGDKIVQDVLGLNRKNARLKEIQQITSL